MMLISLRDPDGHTCLMNSRVLRVVNREGRSTLEAFLETSRAAELITARKLPNTSFLNAPAIADLIKHDEIRSLYERSEGSTIVEHERIPFVSFPYEWPPAMLHAAASLTLDLAESMLEDGLGLKDATPYNVLFRGCKPVFVDLLSFERRDPNDPTWLPFAQFARTFLLPLLLNKHLGLRINQLLITDRDGIEPEQVFALLGPLQKLSPAFLQLVTLPVWLAAKSSANDKSRYRKRVVDDPEKAKFIVRGVLKNARRQLERAEPSQGKSSTWSNYMNENDHAENYFASKQEFVVEAIEDQQPKNVLDVGCNTGHFSAIAAQRGASVVSIDSDEVVVNEVWRRARQEDLDVLPLVVDLARPTPGTGWRNHECQSFLERSLGKFDLVLMLGVIHHMLVSERIPLDEIVKLAAELTSDSLIVEFVTPEDAMFRRIARGRDHLYRDLGREAFENACGRHFEIVRQSRLGQAHRWIYLMKKKGESIECFETPQ
jgi:SAM-dependent methyltransferase